jgi:hypothetical protein
MAKLPVHLLQRSFASSALDVAKLKAVAPCDVDDPINGYKGRITEAVFDPLRIEEVNARFVAEGYKVPDGTQVIAVTATGEILIWGGFNSVFRLAKGEELVGAFDKLAFADILDLTQRFKFKNKKPEIDELIAGLTRKYSARTD